MRALQDWDSTQPGLLVLDEPTASLNRGEVDALFREVHRVADLGAGVLFVSHVLDEVLGLADRVTVLRDGEVVAAGVPVGELDEAPPGRVDRGPIGRRPLPGPSQPCRPSGCSKRRWSSA